METLIADRDEDGRDEAMIACGLAEAETYANSSLEPEQLVLQEREVSMRGATRRYRQEALGIHAGHLLVRRQNPVMVRQTSYGSEYYLG